MCHKTIKKSKEKSDGVNSFCKRGGFRNQETMRGLRSTYRIGLESLSKALARQSVLLLSPLEHTKNVPAQLAIGILGDALLSQSEAVAFVVGLGELELGVGGGVEEDEGLHRDGLFRASGPRGGWEVDRFKSRSQH